MNCYLHLVGCFVSILTLGCPRYNDHGQEVPALALSPRASQTFSIGCQYSELGIVTITVRFSKPIDPNTLQVGQTMFLESLRRNGANDFVAKY